MYNLMHILFLCDNRMGGQTQGVNQNIIGNHGVVERVRIINIPGVWLTKSTCKINIIGPDKQIFDSKIVIVFHSKIASVKNLLYTVKPLLKTPHYNTDIGVAPIRQLCMCVMKIVHIEGRSPNVVKVIFHTIRNYS